MTAGRVIGQSQPAEPIRPIYPSDPLYTYSIEPLALDVCRILGRTSDGRSTRDITLKPRINVGTVGHIDWPIKNTTAWEFREDPSPVTTGNK